MMARPRQRICPATFNTLLPGEPRIADPAVAEALTRQYLSPTLAELETFFLELRAQLDPVLRAATPIKYGKPYPLGQCLEITLAVQKQLPSVDSKTLSPLAQKGHQALTGFLAARGSVRRVWGDLRGQYFQNALLIGNLYVDVSNDTVVITKPKVEILPFAASGLHPIEDFHHFARIAESYWQVCTYPNHVLPELAPNYPVITVTAEGVVRFQEPGDYLTALNWQQAFRPAETYLTQPPMPEAVFASIVHALGESRIRPAPDPIQGRRRALEITRRYRNKRWHQQRQTQQQMLAGGCVVNQRLASTPPPKPADPSPPSPPIPHRTNKVSARASQLQQSLQWTNAEITRLQAQLAAMQTARNVYARALKTALPAMPTGRGS